MVAAAIVMVAGRNLPAQVETPAPASPAANAAEAAREELRNQEKILNDRAATPQQREQAAKRLLARASSDTNEILKKVLVDFGDDRERQLAVLRALASATNPDPTFIEPLTNLLADRGPLTESVAQALAVYKSSEEVRNTLTRFAQNRAMAVTPRSAVIRALGKLVDRRAAASLIDLLNQDENALIRDAAADALAEITGVAQNGRDLQRWNQWWTANRDKSEAQWSLDLLRRNAARVDDVEKRLNRLRDFATATVQKDYRNAPEADQVKILIAYLQNPSEDIRYAAVRLVYNEVAVSGSKMPTPVFETLRAMVGDSATDVRKQVALTLSAANDPGAVTALLAQLSQEQDPDVRAEIARALGPTHDTRAVDPLLERLSDPSFSVARAAADALKDLAPYLRLPDPKNAAMAMQVAARLMQRLQNTEGNMSTASLRQSIVEALGQLGDPSPASLRLFTQLVDSKESPKIRIAALRGLALIANPGSGNDVVNALRDPDPGVRLAAVQTLRTTATLAHAVNLRRLLTEAGETDEKVRSESWDVLSKLLEGGSEQELNLWAEFFKGEGQTELARRQRVLEILEAKLDAAGAEEKLAYNRQSEGETLLKLERPDDAAKKIRQALDYWNNKNAPQAITDLPTQQLLEALLRAKKYDDAIKFATDVIGQPNGTANIPQITLKIKKEVKRLMDARDMKGALDLIAQAKKIPLGPYLGQLNNLEEDVRRAITAGGSIWARRGKLEQAAAFAAPWA